MMITIKKYFYKKSKQFKNASWFLAGFGLGTGFLYLGLGCVILAIVFDFLSVYLSVHTE